jgi:hypothetical protein
MRQADQIGTMKQKVLRILHENMMALRGNMVENFIDPPWARLRTSACPAGISPAVPL